MRTAVSIAAGCLLSFLFGCDQAANQRISLREQVRQLNAQNTELQSELADMQGENERLSRQVNVLSALGGDVRAEKLNRVKQIKIGKYTNFYDKDDDGTKEKLIVYVQPVDEAGDVIKAAGAVDVQLWDLNKDDGEARLGQWTIGPDELKELWFATMLTINYRFVFDVSTIVQQFTEPLTVKVAFTEYLTGRTFTEQKVIKP